MAHTQRIVIIGGSAAGVAAAQALVEAGRRGGVTLVSAEDRLPYKRTKVSKSFAGGFQREAFALHEAAWYADHGVELLQGRRVAALDRAAGTVELEQGQRLPWDHLVLATGAAPNRLPVEQDAAHLVHHAFTAAEVEALRARAERSRTALVVGMGALGVEVAEQLARMGLRVTLAGDTPGVLSDELDATASELLAAVLRRGGVELMVQETVRQIRRADEGVRVELGTREARFDMVVSCVGSRPRADLASQAGLAVERGVVADRCLRTSHPEILAAGDVAQHPDGRVTHLWRHALHQGRVAGLNALGGDEPYRFVPFRLKVEVFGHYFFALNRPTHEADCQAVVHREGERYLCGYYREGRLAGLVMCDDGPNQKTYNQAVVESWEQGRVEQLLGAAAAPGAR